MRNRAQTRRTSDRVSIAEAAEYCGVCTRTIRRYISRGALPAYRVGPKLIKVSLADLDALSKRIPTAGG